MTTWEQPSSSSAQCQKHSRPSPRTPRKKELLVFKVPVKASRSDYVTDPKTKKRTKQSIGKFEGDVYLLATSKQSVSLIPFIQAKAAEEFSKEFQTKECVHLIKALVPIEDWDKDWIGWLDIDLGTFFTHDLELAKKMAVLFSVEFS